MPADGRVTALLTRIRDGDELAFDELLPMVYAELRAMARHRMRGERPEHTLQPTELVHDAYLRLLGEGTAWADRRHFFAAAARAMRQLLIEHARARSRQKRSGNKRHTTLDEHAVFASDHSRTDLLALDEAMNRLAAVDERKARVVELLYFGGFTAEEAAEVVDVTSRTVERDWQYARAWLLRAMSGTIDE